MSSISLLSQANLHKGSEGGKQTEKKWGQLEVPSATSANFFFAFVWELTLYTFYLPKCLLHTSKAALDRVRKKAIINKELKINQLQSSFSLLLRDGSPVFIKKNRSDIVLRSCWDRHTNSCFLQSCSNWIETMRKKNSLISWWVKNLWWNNNYTPCLICFSRTFLIQKTLP